jgi:hypothetical protein
VRDGEAGEAQLYGCPTLADLSPAVSLAMLQCADTIIHEDRCITTQELAFLLSVRKGSTEAIIHELEYSEYAQNGFLGISQSSTKLKIIIAISPELLECFETEGEIFL